MAGLLDGLKGDQAPTLLPTPPEVRGFRVRLDLRGAKPPVWRRLELPGDLTLPQLHDVIQTAMGWYDSHLHRFRTGTDHRSPSFITQFDLDEGEEGMLEDDVRLDQLLAEKGDELCYEYDFGDGWDHRLVVEEVLAEPPSAVRCIGGRKACPPEDCGGIGGYEQLAAWVRSGYDDALLPEGFDNAAHALDWLPVDWHPDHFEVDEANAALAVAVLVAEPVAIAGELADLAEQLDRRGIRRLREALSRPLSHEPTDVTDAEAARITGTYRIFLDTVGEGVTLTGAGYLPPVIVEQFAERSGITTWWIGKANREDLTPAVADVHRAARALGLVSVRKGRLSPTAAARRCRQDPQALRRHIIGRLPLGTKDADRQSGWMALAVVGSGTPARAWDTEISELLFDLGWRSGHDRVSWPPPDSATLDVLEHLAGAVRTGRRGLEGVDLAVAATARAATLPI
ncbi:MAG TPA: plasmid pRiA4b ORF-3 family protein [Nocardioides sp.]|uniref:plasmid pRiA4b ORF-3 family protein n=1 Tax=Nocardioides sp. TaxID=35761 RepID=UPI002B77734B|nr:plasmid pRiA4b ORF-3 family protein [Nocardioides sp.]HTW18094.1 plasmid pRiA4b ORF-3 family protein [Nocardioides sp.]